MLAVFDLRCEYQSNPIGISRLAPRFSWKITSDKSAVLQKSYELQVATDPSFTAILWDSGEVLSEDSLLIPYSGHALTSDCRYYYRVRIKDNYNQQSSWSETGYFHTSLLDTSLWKAKFVTAESMEDAKSSAGTLLRKSFSPSEKPVSATLFVTAKGLYRVNLNGQRVGQDLLTPGWTEYGSRIQFQTYDVTSLVKPGANALGALIGAGWYKGDLAGWVGTRNHYGYRTALLVQLQLHYEDGSCEIISTDETWTWAPAPVTFSELYHGENYDARLEQADWDQGDFDESTWQKVQIESLDLSTVVPQDGPMVTYHEQIEPQSFFTTPAGDKVIDFGQNMSGLVRFRVTGKTGDKVILRHAETLDSAGNFYTENLRSARQTIEYTLKGEGEEYYEPYLTFQGFRYIAIDSFPGVIDPTAFEAVAIYSEMRPTGSFSCSNPLLNRLIKNVEWGMKSNFVDIPTDCPQRDERLGWTGDAQVFVRAASYLMETAPFFSKWLKDVALAQYPDGSVTHVVPNVLKNVADCDDMLNTDTGSCGWGDVAVVAPWVIYNYFQDKEILKSQYASMENWLAYIKAHSQDGLIWNQGFHFGDWVALDAKEGSYFGATPNDLTATAYYAYSTSLMIKAAQALGKVEDEAYYTDLLVKIKKAYADEFFTPAGRLAAPTQTAHVLSLVFDLTPEAYKARTAAGLVALLEENQGHLTTGFLGTPYILYALSENGYLKEAYDLLQKTDYPSWLYQVTQGATTVWEHWDGLKPDGTMWSANMNSFNHYAYGAVADWIFSVVGGLDSDSGYPGYKKIMLAPRPGGELTWAETTYESPYGRISSRWEKVDGNLQFDFSIPPNTIAEVSLPLAKAEILGDNFRQEGELAIAVLGSGTYRFSYPWH